MDRLEILFVVTFVFFLLLLSGKLQKWTSGNPSSRNSSTVDVPKNPYDLEGVHRGGNIARPMESTDESMRNTCRNCGNYHDGPCVKSTTVRVVKSL